MPIIQTAIVYPLVGLNADPFSRVLFFFFIIFLMGLVGSSFGYLVGSIFNDPKVAMGAMPLFLMPFMLFGGFYKTSYAAWIAWFQYVSPFYYGYQALAENEFNGNTSWIINPIKYLDF